MPVKAEKKWAPLQSISSINTAYLKIVVVLVLSVVVFTNKIYIGSSYATDAKPQYKVGERLPTKAVESQIPLIYKELNWDELMPKDWDPMKLIRDIDLEQLQDGDPKAEKLLNRVRLIWNTAPTLTNLNKTRVEIPGFVVPLEMDYDHVREFLLVPYFGACIHTPPPPSNQVIHIINKKPMTKTQLSALKNALLTQGPISVSGVIENEYANTTMGFAGYTINAEIIAPFKNKSSENKGFE